MLNVHSRNTPCIITDKNTKNSEPFDKTKYKSAIGALIYLSVKDLHLKMYIPYTFNYVATIIT